MEFRNTLNKKGLMTFNMLNMIPRLIFLVIVLITFFLAMNAFIKDEPDTRKLEADLLSWDLIYSPEGISYFDPYLNQVIPGTIDLAEFRSGSIESRLDDFFSYPEPNRHISARITLLDYTGEILEGLESVYYNRGTGAYGYEYWEPIAMQRGNHAPEYYIRTMPVRIIDSSNLDIDISGNIIIEVIIPQ